MIWNLDKPLYLYIKQIINNIPKSHYKYHKNTIQIIQIINNIPKSHYKYHKNTIQIINNLDK